MAALILPDQGRYLNAPARSKRREASTRKARVLKRPEVYMSTNMDAVRVFWEEEARTRDAIPQGWSNDAPLMVWEDKERGLRFEWDGDATHHITILHIRPGAVVNHKRFLSFDYRHFRPDWVIAGTKSAVLSFQETCRKLIAAKEEIADEEGLLEAKWNSDYAKGKAYAEHLKREYPNHWSETAHDYQTGGYFNAIASKAYQQGFKEQLEAQR